MNISLNKLNIMYLNHILPKKRWLRPNIPYICPIGNIHKISK